MNNERVELKEAKFEQRQQANLDKLLKTLSSKEYFNAKIEYEYRIKKSVNEKGLSINNHFLTFMVGLFNAKFISYAPLDTHYLGLDKIDISIDKSIRSPYVMPCVDKALKLIEGNLKKLFYVQCHSGD